MADSIVGGPAPRHTPSGLRPRLPLVRSAYRQRPPVLQALATVERQVRKGCPFSGRSPAEGGTGGVSPNSRARRGLQKLRELYTVFTHGSGEPWLTVSASSSVL